MLKRIPEGMYFDSNNAVKRHAINSLKKFLVKLEIKSAEEQVNGIYTYVGGHATIVVSGKPVAFAKGVTFGPYIDNIPVIGKFSVDENP